MKVDIDEAKDHLSRLVDRAAAGEEIIIGRAGKPVARLIAYEPPLERRKLGQWKGLTALAPDFDETDEQIPSLFEESEVVPPSA